MRDDLRAELMGFVRHFCRRQKKIPNVRRNFPILEWGGPYDREAFSKDTIAAVILTIMLIPHSLAFALLAGLPPQAGI